MQKFSHEENRNFSAIDPAVAALFRRYEWPGNVRQLENIMRNMVVLHHGNSLTLDMLPAALRQLAQPSDNIVPLIFGHEPKSATMAAIQPLWLSEKNAIMAALEATGQDIPRAAGLLQVSPSTLYRKLQGWKSEQAAGN